ELAVSAPEHDELAGVLVQALTDNGAVDVTAVETHDPQAAVEAGTADVAVAVPDGFAAAVTAGSQAPVRVVTGDDAGLSGQVLVTMAQGMVEECRSASVAAVAAGAAGLDEGRAGQIAQRVVDAQQQVQLQQGEASSEQLSTGGMLIAGQAGLFLMFT